MTYQFGWTRGAPPKSHTAERTQDERLSRLVREWVDGPMPNAETPPAPSSTRPRRAWRLPARLRALWPGRWHAV
ncbi:hypothetical protein [Embleya sp. NPDC059237]|uniref:hypothetical protein n=1 Tax=Embleya sp. NPDC059237 TaxID=3346784 RepID=UPI0036CF6648